MERQSVSSRNVRSIGYDEASSTLEVEFNSGGIYQYYGVPRTLFTALMGAPSKGSFVSNIIKDHFRCQKIR